ncbi:MAG: outer membrane lipoprotein-sorting protein [Verrucomicrobiaceae bacterium]
MKSLLTICFSFLVTPLSLAQDAEAIMNSVRQVTALQQEQDLHGFIRKGSKKTPLSLFLRGEDIQFALDGGKERFHLRLNKDNQELREIEGGKTSVFPASKIAAPIAKSDVSYEDLALKFLYWDNPRIAGEDKIKGQDCWRVHVANPNQNGRYREVSVWVSKRQSALMRVIGYGPKPKRVPLKQFEITDIMKVNDVYTVKTMKVSAFDDSGRTTGITYLEFDKPKPVARRGR